MASLWLSKSKYVSFVFWCLDTKLSPYQHFFHFIKEMECVKMVVEWLVKEEKEKILTLFYHHGRWRCLWRTRVWFVRLEGAGDGRLVTSSMTCFNDFIRLLPSSSLHTNVPVATFPCFSSSRANVLTQFSMPPSWDASNLESRSFMITSPYT